VLVSFHVSPALLLSASRQERQPDAGVAGLAGGCQVKQVRALINPLAQAHEGIKHVTNISQINVKIIRVRART
jgi:hypothetical protein